MRRPEHWYLARLQNVDVTRAYLSKGMTDAEIESLIKYELKNRQRLRTLDTLHARLYRQKRKRSWKKLISNLNQ